MHRQSNCRDQLYAAIHLMPCTCRHARRYSTPAVIERSVDHRSRAWHFLSSGLLLLSSPHDPTQRLTLHSRMSSRKAWRARSRKSRPTVLRREFSASRMIPGLINSTYKRSRSSSPLKFVVKSSRFTMTRRTRWRPIAQSTLLLARYFDPMQSARRYSGCLVA